LVLGYSDCLRSSDVPPFTVPVPVVPVLGFIGDEVWSRGRRLNPLLQHLCISFPHILIPARVRANSAAGR